MIKKILVFLPVLLLGYFYITDHAHLFGQASGKRLLVLVATFLVLYAWVFTEVMLRRQDTYWQIAVQSSFFLYVFMVLTLTGYFILFKELGGGEWWDHMLNRIERRDHVNVRLLQIFRIYEMSNTQIIGNFFLLFPLAIYIQLLYRRFSNFFITLLLCILVSIFIEILQLATRRSADVDDVLLNSAGALAGLLLFRMVRFLAIKMRPSPSLVSPGSSSLA